MTLSELQIHPYLHTPFDELEITQIKHTQICALTPGQDQPYKNKHAQICTLSVGMTALLTYSSPGVHIRGVWSPLRPLPISEGGSTGLWYLRVRVGFRFIFSPSKLQTAEKDRKSHKTHFQSPTSCMLRSLV